MSAADSNGSRDGLTSQQTIVVCGLLLAIGGSVAYGVPALMERHHATEAIDMLGKLSRAAAVYYVKPNMDEKTGDRAPCGFPTGKVRSALASSCCDESVRLAGTNLCDPAKMEWNRTLWHALGRFQLRDAHAFVYEYDASGYFGDAAFTVSAYADLDCDGVISTYRFVGKGDPDASPDNCVLKTTPIFTSENAGE